MNIDKIISNIRSSNIGTIMYRVKPISTYMGTFGLKQRPPDADFLESGPVENLDHGPTIKKTYKFFRTIIPKDFAVTVHPSYWTKNLEEQLYPVNEYHLIDIDVYAYLVLAEGVRLNLIPSTSNDYAHLFYSDGRQIDYTEALVSNMNKYTFILKHESNLIPYVYQKKNPSTFAELGIDDFLVASSFVTHEDLASIFENLNIFSNNKNTI
jgi:hypothetical protein